MNVFGVESDKEIILKPSHVEAISKAYEEKVKPIQAFCEKWGAKTPAETASVMVSEKELLEFTSTLDDTTPLYGDNLKLMDRLWEELQARREACGFDASIYFAIVAAANGAEPPILQRVEVTPIEGFGGETVPIDTKIKDFERGNSGDQIVIDHPVKVEELSDEQIFGRGIRLDAPMLFVGVHEEESVSRDCCGINPDTIKVVISDGSCNHGESVHEHDCSGQ